MALRANPNVTEDDLTEAGRRKAASLTLTDEQVRDHLLEKRRERAEQSTEPPITRPADRLRPGLDPAVALNRKTRGVPVPPDEPTACRECGSDDHPTCPADALELRPITRDWKGRILDRQCPACGLRESDVIKKGLGAQLYRTTGLKASMERYVDSAMLGGDFS